MSAIIGIFRRDRDAVDVDALDRMIDMLGHRGPDGAGQWHQGAIGLAHCMLHITPESLDEHMPLLSDDGNLVVTADARIDNREDLFKHLNSHGRLHSEVTDSDLILAAYEKWGEACPRHLIGAFAFAIWDNSKRRLFCARDHIGLRPFYYYLAENIFVFASEIKALFCVPDVPRQVNDLAIGLHLSATESDGTITFFKNIVRLLPAHSMIVDCTGIRTQSYWSLDANRKLQLASDTEYIEAFREHFLTAVRCCLRSAFPIGIYLSGGVDSSSVASAARFLLDDIDENQPLHTFSAIFPSLPEAQLRLIDERQYVKAVVERPGMRSHFIRGDHLRPLTNMKSSTWYQDGIYYGPTMYMEEAICEAAQANGVRVLLTGIDGDTIVSHGWEYLPELAASGRWLELIKIVNAYKRNTGRSFSRKSFIWRTGFQPLLDYALTQVSKRWHNAEGSTDRQLGAISREFAKRIRLQDHIFELENSKAVSPLKARMDHWQGMVSPLNAYILELINKSNSPYLVEERHPFYDRRLMEFCLAIPPRLKLHQGWPRGILRYAMQGIMPPKVQWRWDKSDLGHNFRHRLPYKNNSLIHEMVTEPGLIESYVDIDVIRQAAQELESGGKLSDDRMLALYQSATLYAGLKWLDFDFQSRPGLAEFK